MKTNWRKYNESIANKLFEQVIMYDENKYKLCNEHGIKLFYISYKDNIKEKLNELVKTLKAPI